MRGGAGFWWNLGEKMKKERLFSCSFGVLGVILAVTALLICLTQREAEPKLIGGAPEAESCAMAMMEKLSKGDFQGASGYLQGTPSLITDTQQLEPAAKLLWEAFASSLNAVPQGRCYATVSGVAQDYTLSRLDVPEMIRQLKEFAPAVLESRVEAAEEMSQIYDENRQYRENFTRSVLEEAASEIIAASTPRETTVTVRLTYQEGQWWVVPDEALLTAISGGII